MHRLNALYDHLAAAPRHRQRSSIERVSGETKLPSTIIVDKKERIGIITLNRPSVLNALSPQLVAEVLSALRDFDHDPTIAVVIIHGGPKVFAAGADIKGLINQTTSSLMNLPADAPQLGQIGTFRKPLIAAVNGYAFGGGCEVALMCDIIIAGEDAKFGLPEIKLGTIPGAGGTQRLVKAIGKYKAMEMVLTGNSIPAQEAERAGLVTRVVPPDQVLEVALQIAGRISSLSQIAVRTAKQSCLKADELGLSAGLEAEQQLFRTTFATEDRVEGMKAFIEKRKPMWKDK